MTSKYTLAELRGALRLAEIDQNALLQAVLNDHATATNSNDPVAAKAAREAMDAKMYQLSRKHGQILGLREAIENYKEDDEQ